MKLGLSPSVDAARACFNAHQKLLIRSPHIPPFLIRVIKPLLSIIKQLDIKLKAEPDSKSLPRKEPKVRML